jgi:hypothetical protein
MSKRLFRVSIELLVAGRIHGNWTHVQTTINQVRNVPEKSVEHVGHICVDVVACPLNDSQSNVGFQTAGLNLQGRVSAHIGFRTVDERGRNRWVNARKAEI